MQHSATRQPPDEAVTSGRAKRRPERRRPVRLETHDRFGGTEGNEILTSATAVVLTGLLVAEGLTIVHMGGLVSAHMFIGMVLIPPVLLKLASTGYRFVRYYTGSRVYRAKGPPPLPMRLLAPALVATTLGVFVTGVLLLLAGHKSDTLLLVHKVSFIVWGVVFAVHFLAYVPRVVRSLRADWGAARREAVRRRPEGAAGGRRARRRRCAGTLAAAGDGRLARLTTCASGELVQGSARTLSEYRVGLAPPIGLALWCARRCAQCAPAAGELAWEIGIRAAAEFLQTRSRAFESSLPVVRPFCATSLLA
jgi:hypothetical protein